MRLCVCGISLEGRRIAIPPGRSSLFCGDTCRQRLRRKELRRKRMLAAIALRPRCMICDAPIRYGEYGVRYDSTTCGNLRCAAAKRDWFGGRRGTTREEVRAQQLRRMRSA